MLRLERGGTLLALGGGSTTDVAGFAAATYLRGIDWVAVPTTLPRSTPGSEARQRSTSLRRTSSAPSTGPCTVIDPALLETLPEAELANGRAEVVKTGPSCGETLWELPLPEQIRRAAAFKTAVCLRDPRDRGERAQLNLGHTRASRRRRATSCRTGAPSRSPAAALRLSGLDTGVVEHELRHRGRPRLGVVGAHAGQEGRRPASRVSSCSRRPAGREPGSSCPEAEVRPRSMLLLIAG